MGGSQGLCGRIGLLDGAVAGVAGDGLDPDSLGLLRQRRSQEREVGRLLSIELSAKAKAAEARQACAVDCDQEVHFFAVVVFEEVEASQKLAVFSSVVIDPHDEDVVRQLLCSECVDDCIVDDRQRDRGFFARAARPHLPIAGIGFRSLAERRRETGRHHRDDRNQQHDLFDLHSAPPAQTKSPHRCCGRASTPH